jgi:hypothetical protein
MIRLVGVQPPGWASSPAGHRFGTLLDAIQLTTFGDVDCRKNQPGCFAAGWSSAFGLSCAGSSLNSNKDLIRILIQNSAPRLTQPLARLQLAKLSLRQFELGCVSVAIRLPFGTSGDSRKAPRQLSQNHPAIRPSE